MIQELIDAEIDRLAKEFGPPKNDIEEIMVRRRLFNIQSEDLIGQVVDEILTKVRKRTVSVVVSQCMRYKNLDPTIVERVVRRKLEVEPCVLDTSTRLPL
jgi:hypothetical protein